MWARWKRSTEINRIDWLEIGTSKQTVEEAERTDEAMVATYNELGYQLVHLPCVCVAERMQFVRAQIDEAMRRG